VHRAGRFLNHIPALAESRDSAIRPVAFTGLATLLLAFFVMPFAISEADLRDWQNPTAALVRGLDTGAGRSPLRRTTV